MHMNDLSMYLCVFEDSTSPWCMSYVGEQSNEMETTFPRFKSFTLAAKLKQKSFVASAALCAEEQEATTISTVIHSRREMNENENNYKVDGLL